MQAGRLRHRVTIQEKNASRNTYGEEVPAWSEIATVWAGVEPLRGREYLEMRQVQAEVTTRIRMRYLSGIAPEMRVVWGNHTYDILTVIHINTRGAEMQLLCSEVVTEAVNS
jgi:SPP1 family predicted phage head-tail adaptor